MWWEIVGWTLCAVGCGFALYVIGSLIHEERQFKAFRKKMERDRRERELADAYLASSKMHTTMVQTYLTYSTKTGRPVNLPAVVEAKKPPAAPADWVGDAPKVDFL